MREGTGGTRAVQHVELAFSGQESFEVRHNQAPGGMRSRADGPVAVERDEEAPPVDSRRRVGRYLYSPQLASSADEQIVVVEIDSAIDEFGFVFRDERRIRADHDILLPAFEDHFRISECLAPSPELHDPGIAGVRHRVGAEVPRDEQPVLPGPGERALGLGQIEAVWHERPGRQVEFAYDDRVRAAAGQGDEAAVVGRLEELRTCEDPVLALFLRQRVDVENGLPRRVAFAVFVQGNPAPEPPRMFGVLPEIVVVQPRLRDVGNPVAGVENRPQPPLGCRERLSLCQCFPRVPIAAPDPRHGPVAIDVLEPEIGVVFARLRHVDLSEQEEWDDLPNHGSDSVPGVHANCLRTWCRTVEVDSRSIQTQPSREPLMK